MDRRCCRSTVRCCSRSSTRTGHVQPIAIRYCAVDGSFSDTPAYVGDTSFMASFWRVLGERQLVVEVTLPPALPAAGRHRRELSREAETRYSRGVGLAGCRLGTWNNASSSRLSAVSAPPHRQPESSMAMRGASMSSSVDQ